MKNNYKSAMLILILIFACFHCDGQSNENKKLLNQADELHKSSHYGAEIDILNTVIKNDPNNALLYKRRGDAWRNFENNKQALDDYSIAILKIENNECKCDLTQYFNNEKKNEHCTIYDLKHLYNARSKIYEIGQKYDLAIADKTKAIGLFYNGNGNFIVYPDSYSGASYYIELEQLYFFRAQDYIETRQYPNALIDYNKRAEILKMYNAFDAQNFRARAGLNFINGNYSEAIADLKAAGMENFNTQDALFTNKELNHPEFVFNYLSSLIALRHFNEANDLLKKHKKNTVVLEDGYWINCDNLLGHVMHKKSESPDTCQRIDSADVPYSFYNFYKCVLKSIVSSNYQEALTRVEIQQRVFKGSLLNTNNNISNNWYLMESNLLSLKGYLLAKLNRSADAINTYKSAVAVNPSCKEAIKEMKLIKY